jgi:hypothetical protein
MISSMWNTTTAYPRIVIMETMTTLRRRRCGIRNRREQQLNAKKKRKGTPGLQKMGRVTNDRKNVILDLAGTGTEELWPAMFIKLSAKERETESQPEPQQTGERSER